MNTVFAENYSVDKDKLFKLKDHPNEKCVAYFQYQGETYCSRDAPSEQSNTESLAHEKQFIEFDERIWQAAWSKEAEYITTIQYVPKGDNINDWSELMTTQFVPNAQDKISPEQFALLSIDEIKKLGYTPIITLLSSTPDETIIEWRLDSPSSQIQDEIKKVTKGKDGLYIIAYTIKKADMGEKNRQLWIKHLKSSYPKNQ